NMLERIVKNLVIRNSITLKKVDYISITITAELSDAFQTKREGISTILDALEQVFDTEKMFFINNNSKFINFSQTKKQYTSIAAANWASSSLFLGKYVSKCIYLPLL
ncbi:unnamed protein product, partial [marine sediment metagenome]